MSVAGPVSVAKGHPKGFENLRLEVRGFLQKEMSEGSFVPWVDTWLTRWNVSFTRKIAERGWIGMTIPEEYGGHGRSFMERFVVTEELLAVGAPVAAQWVADRQIAPTLLRFGTEEQKRSLLPRIVTADLSFGIGMSEPESGSDLASVQMKARRVEGGWSLSGLKTWTSGAHEADALFVLARTEPVDFENRHAGLSQFILNLRDAGVRVSPILSMGGGHHFNEVALERVFVPENRVLGKIGSGWDQVTSELAYERSGPERFLSTYPLLSAVLKHTSRSNRDSIGLGRHIARLAGLHQMSMQVAEALEGGLTADLDAAIVKVLGTTEEGDLVSTVERLLGLGMPPQRVPEELRELLDAALLQRPGFTLRGGTNEILRGVIARALGLR